MRFALVLVGLVVVVQYASANCGLGCGCGCAASASFPCNCGCGLEGSGESMCKGTKDCVPMVVRPAEYEPSFIKGSGGGLSGLLGGKSAAEALAAAASALSFKPVPGPCITKKAIVKPAVLPKPVFRPPPPTCVCDCNHNFEQSCSSSTIHHLEGCNVPTVNGIQRGNYRLFPGSRGPTGVYGPNGAYGPDGPYGPNGPFGVYGPDGRTCADNQANCAAADAVSLSLAYKMAQQENYNHMANEDKLNFGFRKIPMELPVKTVPQNNVPEEKIFSLNGQIVELKPVKVGSRKTLAEEAAEELVALQDEEEENANAPSSGVSGGIRKVSLGELGYAPAKLSNPTFVNVPGSLVETGIDAVSSALNEATGSSSSSSSGCSCSCNGCGSCPTCKMIPGNVDYKILPKAPQVCISPPPAEDSCESAEACISEEQPSNCQISCVPVCVRKHHKTCSSCSKSSMSFQKIM